MDEAVDFYQQTYWPNMAKKDLRAQQFLTDPFAKDGGEFLYIPLYYYKKVPVSFIFLRRGPRPEPRHPRDPAGDGDRRPAGGQHLLGGVPGTGVPCVGERVRRVPQDQRRRQRHPQLRHGDGSAGDVLRRCQGIKKWRKAHPFCQGLPY